MNQVIVSYILGRLAKVADVNPSDVKTSLFHGTIEIHRLTVREELLKKLPIPLTIQVIPLISIKLPNPASSDSVKVKISGVHVKVPLHAIQHPPQSGGKLWDDLTPDMLFTDEDAAAMQQAEEGHCPYDNKEDDGHVTPDDDQSVLGDSLTSLPNSDLDEADLASCQSDVDMASCSSSSSFDDEAPSSGGAFAFFKDRMKRSVEWIMERKVEVDLEDTKVEFLVDERKGVSVMGSIQRASACVNPSSKQRESIRHINFSVVDILFKAVYSQLNAPLLRVEKVEVNLSLINSLASGKLIRMNTAVEVNVVQVALDEASVKIVAKCVPPTQAMLSIPSFCWPHLHLRTNPSWWPYAKACIQSQAKDLKQRYNYNMSHIHFYANSRRRYLRLLDECCKDRLIGSRAEDLEELENDLRFPDVINFLRRTVQQKYGITPTAHFGPPKFPQKAASDLSPSSPTKTPKDEVSQSVHVDVKLIRLKLPLRTALTINDTHVVQRLNEVHLYVKDLGFEKDGVAVYAKTSQGESLIAAEIHRAVNRQEVKLLVEPCVITLSLLRITEILSPLLAAITQKSILEAVEAGPPAGFGKSSGDSENLDAAAAAAASTASSSSTKTQVSTLFFIFPSLFIRVDEFALLVRGASVVVQNSSGLQFPQFGVNLEELSIKWAQEYFLHPLRIKMLKDDAIKCSPSKIQLSNRIWGALKSSWNLVMTSIPNELLLLARKPKKVTSQPIVVGSLGSTVSVQELLDVDIKSWKKPRWAQNITIDELNLEFELLSLSARVTTVVLMPAFSSGCDSCGWRIGVRKLDVSLREENRHCVQLLADFSSSNVSSSNTLQSKKDGVYECLQVLLQPSGQMAIHLHSVAVTHVCPGFALPFEIASMSRLEVGVHNSNTAARVRNMTALEGVIVKDVLVGMLGEPLAYQDRPYLASTIQLGARIFEVDLRKVSRFVPDVLISMGVHLESIISAEMVSQPAYNTFYSGFSHIMFSIGLTNCPVIVSDANRLLLTLEHVSLESKDTVQRKVKRLLPESLIPGIPIVMYADVENLTTFLMIGQLGLCVSAPSEVTTARVHLRMKEGNCRIPIPKFEVWNRRVLEKPSILLNASVSEIQIGTSVPQMGDGKVKDFEVISLEVGDLFFEKLPELKNASHASNDVQSLQSNSTNSTEDGLNTNNFKVETQNVRLSAFASHPIAVYRSLFGLVEQFQLIPKIFGHETVITFKRANESYVLEETGDIFFDAETPSEVLVVDSCDFRSSVTERCLVVADGTAVLFRDCVFSHQTEQFIRAAGPSAFFFCENCTDTIVKKKLKTPAPDTAVKFKALIEHFDASLQLTTDTYLRVNNQLIEASLTQKPSLLFTRFRVSGDNVEVADEGLKTLLCSKISIESELSYKPKKKALAVNLSLSLGEVTVPLITHILPQLTAIQEIPLQAPPPRKYVVPPPVIKSTSAFPLDEWKFLLFLSVVPINIVLRNGCTIAKTNISSGYIWTTYEPPQRNVATIEGHLCLSHLSLLEFSSGSFLPVTSGPVDVNVAGEALDQHTITLNSKLSLGEVKWTTEQLRLLTTLAQHCDELKTTAVRIINHTGEKLELQYDSNKKVVLEDGETQQLTNYIALQETFKVVSRVGDASFDHVEKAPSNPAIYGMERAVSFSTYNLVLVDGQQYFMVKAVTHHFVQEIQVYTEFQIKNETQYTLCFSSAGTAERSSQSFWIPPQSLSCIPSYMMDAKSLKISLKSGDFESSSDFLWAQDCPIEFMELALSQEDAPQTLHKSLRFSPQGSFNSVKSAMNTQVFVDINFEVRRSGTVYMYVTPSQPELRNRTLFPMEIDVVNGGGQLESRRQLEPGGLIHHYDLNPGFPHEFRVRVLAGTNVFESSETFSFASDSEELSVLVRHQNASKRRFFELTAVPCKEAGSHIRGWIIITPQLCYLESRCQRSVRILGSDGDPVGSLEAQGLPPSCEGVVHNGGYVPLKTPVFLKFDNTTVSGPFEITSTGEGNVVECGLEDDNPAVRCIALIRPLQGSFFFAMEILPPLLLVNETTKGNIRLKHEVFRKGKRIFSNIFLVSPGSQGVPYFTLAAPGYSNCFSFAWENEDFSYSMESSLAPGTSWTGLLECGSATHRVIISKKGPYDPAVISIGPPQRLHFQFINLTYSEFAEAPYMSVRRCASPLFLAKQVSSQSAETIGAWDQQQMVISRCNGVRYRIRVAEDSVQEVEPDLFIYTVVHRDEMTTVVACGWNLNNGAVAERVSQSRMNITASLSLPPCSFSIQYGKSILELSLQGINIWATISNTYSVQSTISGVTLSTRLNGKHMCVIAPFEINTSLRDAKMSFSAVSVQSFQCTVTPVVIIVSDYFLGQLYQILTTCVNAPPSSFKQEWRGNRLIRYTSDTAVACPMRIYLESATISSIRLEVSWDRSVSAPKDTIQSILPWWMSLIPSLHHATLSTPQVNFKQLSRDSFGSLGASVQTLYLKELLKQIPKFVGTVGLFKKNTSIFKNLASRIGGLFFDNSGNNSVSGSSSTLI